MTCVCIDAGVVVKLVSPEADSDRVERLFDQWKTGQVELIAPLFAAAEIDSVLRQQLLRGDFGYC